MHTDSSDSEWLLDKTNFREPLAADLVQDLPLMVCLLSATYPCFLHTQQHWHSRYSGFLKSESIAF